MRASDRLRVENAVFSYSFWLDLRGIAGRRRRDLRRELRANLQDAAALTAPVVSPASTPAPSRSSEVCRGSPAEELPKILTESAGRRGQHG